MGCEPKALKGATDGALIARGWEPSDSVAAPAITSISAAGTTRFHNRPVPNPRRFNLTSSSEVFNSGGEEEERTLRGPGHSGRQARFSVSSEKINKYLNIQWMAVSRERGTARSSSVVRCALRLGKMPGQIAKLRPTSAPDVNFFVRKEQTDYAQHRCTDRVLDRYSAQSSLFGA